MNDVPEYFRAHNCPDVKLGNQSVNCLMYVDDLLVISNSPEGLQQSLNVIYKHAQEWKLKVNTKNLISSYLAEMDKTKTKQISNTQMKL